MRVGGGDAAHLTSPRTQLLSDPFLCLFLEECLLLLVAAKIVVATLAEGLLLPGRARLSA